MKKGVDFNTQNWNDRLTTIPGGLPVEVEGEIIGGVGVSGGTIEQDVILCHAILYIISDS